jgi:hypothetical protein
LFLLRCNHAGYFPLATAHGLRGARPDGLLTLVVEVGVDKGAKFLLLLWRTWHVRNNITHGSDKISFDASVGFLQKYWLELCDIRQLQGASDSKGKHSVAESLCLNHARKCRQEARWEAPPQDFLKVNVDGALMVLQELAALELSSGTHQAWCS